MVARDQGSLTSMPASVTLDGTRIHDIPSFHAEINRVFMTITLVAG